MYNNRVVMAYTHTFCKSHNLWHPYWFLIIIGVGLTTIISTIRKAVRKSKGKPIEDDD